jgi:opacity protein-like surface antigen
VAISFVEGGWLLRKLGTIGSAFLVAATFGAARADDLPIPVKAAPAPPTAAPWNWTGFYIGGHIGGALENSTLADPFGAVSFGDNVRSPAFIGGGQVGANYQIGNVVLGAEADLSWADSSGDNTCFGISGGHFFASNCGVAPDLFGTITGRLGYTFGPTLLYAKGGAAWEQNNVNMIVNNNPGSHVLTSASQYGAWGWTVGGGVEYALTPAWSLKLEYDYLGFGTSSVATPYVPGNPLPGHPVALTAGLSDNVQEVKLGVNYRFGADPTLWPPQASVSPLIPFMPLKAPPPVISGWEIEGGARYMFSSGREQWDLPLSNNRPSNMLISRLTWDNLQSNSAELFGRIDTPWNVFLSGFIGAGNTFRGGQNDEDFNLTGPARAYNNTFSTNNGNINYAVVDLGYDLARTANYKVGPFVGYTYFNQDIFKGGCQQIANSIGNCIVGGVSAPLASSQLIGSEAMTWQGVRVGLSGQVKLADRVKLTADAAFIPYVAYTWLDDHLDRDAQFSQWGHGVGTQTQAVLSYDVTEQLGVGVGARYWAMWSTSASVQDIPGNALRPNRNAIELAGAFVQTSYRFVPNAAVAGTSSLSSWAPILKAPPAVQSYNWTGLYGGVEGGGVFGRSKQIGELAASSDTSDATPWYNVDGGLVGGTIGYNSQFYRIFVYGFEGDASWVDARGSAAQIGVFRSDQTGVTTQDWLGTARVRIGVTPANGWLVYGTGGLAVADVAASVIGDFAPEHHVRPGWTAGGGIEAAITGNWSAKLEYLFVGLENQAYFVPTPNDPNRSTRAGGVLLNDNIVRGGINYRISWL